MNNNSARIARKHNLLYACIFFLFLLSMGHWIGWDDRITRLNFVIGLIICCLVIGQKIELTCNKRNVLSYLFLIFAYLFIYEISLRTILTYCFPAFFIIMLNDYDRIRCFKFIYRWFAILMIPSMIAFLMYRMGGLPSVGRIMVSNTDIYHPLWYLLRENHIFLVTFVLRIQEDTLRFCGMFIEPGHLGMMCAFLLYAYRFNMRDSSTWVIIVATLLTMALSAYILTFIGYLLVKFEKGEIRIKFIILFLLLIILVYLFGTYYNNGNNLFNEYILSRLEPDEEKGIAGNNRVFGEVDLYFITMFTDFRLMLFGYDMNTIESLLLSGSGGAGIKMFIVYYGVLGLLAAFSFYVCYALLSRDKRNALFCLFFVFIMFFQRSYWFWFAWIICFTYGITYCEQKVSSSKRITSVSIP